MSPAQFAEDIEGFNDFYINILCLTISKFYNMIPYISWKNIWRNKVRSLVVMVAVVFGMFGGIFSYSVMIGMTDQRIKKAIENEVSHIQIRHPQFAANREAQYAVGNSDSVLRIIGESGFAKGASARMLINGMASSSRSIQSVVINGVNKDDEVKTCYLYKTIADTSGTFLTIDTLKRRISPIVISKRIAEKLKVRLKSKIIIRCQRADSSLSEAAFAVSGIYHTGNQAFDQSNVFVRKKELVALTGFPAENANQVAILLRIGQDLDTALSAYKKAFPQYEVISWKTIQPDLGYMTEMMDFMLIIIMAIILLALGFAIVNTMLMAVLERVKELGMLMAIGMNRLKVFSMIMFETVLLTLTGGLAGLAFSYLAVLYFGESGLSMSVFGEGYESYGYDSFIYPKFDLHYYLLIALMVLATGIIASVYPAIKALKLKPAEAVRIDN
jgi:putative ABC transport system permease protein